MSKVTQSDIHVIITDPNGAEILVRQAELLGKDLNNMGLTTSQIRAIFGEVRQIQTEWTTGETGRKNAIRKLILLKPKMAYRARKERGRAVQELVAVLDQALDEIIKEKAEAQQSDNFHRFVEFFEAILAYHKAYGGY